ncbi:MAG: hypothetical protein WC449_03340 [Candidatus Paceibacterota bacterium]
MAATQQLIDYVKNRLETDESQLKIKDELKANGWTDVDISEAFIANGIGMPLPVKKRSPWTIAFLFFSSIGFIVAGYCAYDNLARPQAKFLLEKSFEKLQSLKYYSMQMEAKAEAYMSGQKVTAELAGAADNDFEFLDNPQNKTELALTSSLTPEIKVGAIYKDGALYFNSDYVNEFLGERFSSNVGRGTWLKIEKQDVEKIANSLGASNPEIESHLKGYYEKGLKGRTLFQDAALSTFTESKFVSVGNYLGKKKIGNDSVYAFELLFDRQKFSQFLYDVIRRSGGEVSQEVVEKIVDMLSVKQIELWVMHDYTPRRLIINGDIVLDEPSYETPKIVFSLEGQWLNINKKPEIVAPVKNIVSIAELMRQPTNTVKEP